MAIIKCPECGRQISDKAPICPNCGVEIAGKITKCTQCGETYFSNQAYCPNCQHPTYAPGDNANASTAEPVQNNKTSMPGASVSAASSTPDNEGQDRKNSQKKKVMALIAALCIALLVGGTGFYFYYNAKKAKEKEAFAFAIRSDDPTVLQTYLDNHLDAPTSHRDSIMLRLELLKKIDKDWTNVLVSGSRAALADYLAKHPDSEYSIEAKHKIDSIDWESASNENTMEAMQLYLTRHANGEHVDEANMVMKEIKAKTVQDEDRNMVASSLRRFFQSINARNEADLQASVTPVISNFLGKTNASKADVVTFMNKIYKDDITNMNWYLNDDYQINKKEIGIDQYEYTVAFSAIQKIERTDPSKEKEVRYQITASINPDGLISAMSMTKILE
jgi:hypothetical protein